MSNLKDTSLPVLMAGVAALTATTVATITYYWTKQREDAKHNAHIYREYEREKMLKAKTAQARMQKEEPPSGTLLKDVTIDKIFLWELEDLSKKYPSALVENMMHNKSVGVSKSSIRSPVMRQQSSVSDSDEKGGHSHGATPYNKLISNHECIVADIVRKPNMHTHTVAFVRAGARRLLHFDPKHVNAAIVTCGGLCPGLNNVIREITKTLHQSYAIGGKVYGIQGGFRGFHDPNLQPLILTPELVDNIHHEGGTVLGSSRGGFDLDKILNFIQTKKINQLYVIGGDGTHRGAFRLHEGCMERGLNVAVAGIPKTIDNDVDYIDQSFGFQSAVEAAQVAIRSAKTEAVCNLPNGVGIVKLMGRSAGYIAAHATMASSDVDLCLVPEVPVVLEGPNGCLPHLRRRVKHQGYAVVVVAEGAGEEVLGTSAETDASGNKKLPPIGEFMKKVVTEHFAKFDEVATVKYIDPSYTVRSVPANAADSLYCMQLAQNACHGAMAGFTGFSVGLCNNRMVWLPIPELVATSPRSMNANGRTWERVLALTRQPNTVEPKEEAKEKKELPKVAAV
mmetsp:Transcript_21683/g.49984  ORF Transcript_21683/g.49984 Transcript_21683/m.49984 type:complete len:565 (+) Transcript_21683:154-1848(+)